MKKSPTYIIIKDDYTQKNTVVKATNIEALLKEIQERISDYKVSFHVVGAYGVGESDTISYINLEEVI